MTQATRFSPPRTSIATRSVTGGDRTHLSEGRSLLFAHPKTASLAILTVSVALGVLAALTLDAQTAAAAMTLPPWMRQAAAWITLLGLSNYMLVMSALAAAGGVLVARRNGPGAGRRAALRLRDRAVFFFVAVAGSGIAAQIVKHCVGRARPKLFDTVGAFHFDLFSINASLASLPSGHATSAFAAAATLGVMLPRWRVPLFVLACLIAASRVAVGAHYVSDVIAGAALGLVFTIALAAFFATREWVFAWRGEELVLLGGREARRERNPGLEPSA